MKFYTQLDVAKILCCSRTTTYVMLREGRLAPPEIKKPYSPWTMEQIKEARPKLQKKGRPILAKRHKRHKKTV